MPPLSIQAIEPPPAPIVRMSIIGIWIGTPHSISKCGGETFLAVDDRRYVGRGAAHVERHECRRRAAGRYAGWRSRRRSGPTRVISIGASAAASSVISPPFDLMTTACCGHPARPRTAGAYRAAGTDDWLDVGVGDRGRCALIFLPLRQHFEGNRHRQVGRFLGEDLPLRAARAPD